MFIEKLFGASLTLDFISGLILAAVVVLLTAIAFLLPKSDKAKKIIGIVLLVCMAAVLVVPSLLNAELGKTMFNGGFTTYMVIVMAVILLYGLIFNKSHLAQALYGITASVALPFGLLRLLVPTWTNAISIAQIFTSNDVISLLLYAVIYFVAIWLVASGTYRLNLSAIWHIFYGFIVFGSVMVFSTQAGLTHSKTAIDMLKFFTVDGFSWKNVSLVALPCLMGLLVILVIALTATLWRKYVKKTGEKIIQSETSHALAFRLVGKIVAILASGATLVFMPNLLEAVLVDFTYYSHVTEGDFVGMPTALLFLAPILVLAIIMLIFEFLAEDHEIKIAQAQFEAGYTPEN